MFGFVNKKPITIDRFEIIEERHFNFATRSAVCPVCGIRRLASNIRTHVAKAAMGEKQRGIYDQHYEFYMNHTDKEIIVRRKWKI